jgi:hypothetical protein
MTVRPTWLDRELASPSRTTLANTGFGREVTEAMERRRQSLVNMGHAVRFEDGRIRVSKDFVANLERTEVTGVGKAMAAERGLTFTAAKTGEYVSGTLVGSAQLASGRFATIDDGIGFQLVPWQPVFDKRIGQHISSISPAQCALLVASNGVWEGNGGWGYECPQHRYLLIAMGPDRRHSVKARALRAPINPSVSKGRTEVEPSCSASASSSRPGRRRIVQLVGVAPVKFADVAEMVDALVSGTSSSKCGFESLRPHQTMEFRCEGNVSIMSSRRNR